MISGVVTARREATIDLTVHGPHGAQQQVTAVIDTGFTGALTLSPRTIANLGLTWRGQERALLADGRRRLLDFHEATVDWDGQARRVVVLATGATPLIGMRLLNGYQLTVDVTGGGAVTITALSPS